MNKLKFHISFILINVNNIRLDKIVLYNILDRQAVKYRIITLLFEMAIFIIAIKVVVKMCNENLGMGFFNNYCESEKKIR